MEKLAWSSRGDFNLCALEIPVLGVAVPVPSYATRAPGPPHTSAGRLGKGVEQFFPLFCSQSN